MTDYSQYEEQKYIEQFFGSYTGTFLDIGAADGITFSNVYRLLLNGWKGVSVEPDSHTVHRLINLYKQFSDRSEILLAVLDTQEQFLTFYENGQLSSTSHEHMANWEHHRLKHNSEWQPVTHYSITLNRLLSHYSDHNFDFISVDLEGQNYNVVSTTDWNLVPTCKLLCIEHDQRQEDFIQVLVPYGFTEYQITPVNILLSRE